jgi:mannose-6-phosphate isomerase-like protein (cupin superfamily)
LSVGSGIGSPGIVIDDDKEARMPSPYTIRNLNEVEDSAAKFGFGDVGEARFANDDLETEQTGVSHHRVKPNSRQAFAHKHDDVEEVYFVVSGSGRIKLDDDIVEINELDAIRISPEVVRCLEGGSKGIEVLAFSPRRKDDRGEMLSDWWRD